MFGRRKDGKKLKKIDPFFRVVPHIMKRRYDAQVFFLHPAQCESLDEFIKEQRENGISFNYMDIVIAGVVRLLALRPQLNRFVMNGRLYKRNNIQISFTMKKVLKDDAPDTTVKLEFTGHESIHEVKEMIDAEITKNRQATSTNETDRVAKLLTRMPNFLLKFFVGMAKFLDRRGLIPRSLLKASPFHTSCFVTNMKSIKLDYVYHHLYEFGTTSIFLSMGKEHEAPIVKNGELAVGKVMNLGFVTDERICDGLYYGNSLRLFKRILNNPRILLENLDEINEDID